MDHPYSFSTPQPYQDFMQIAPIADPESLSTSLTGFGTNLHHTTHGFHDSPISPLQSPLSPRQFQFHQQHGNSNTMRPVRGDSGTSEDDDGRTNTADAQSERKAQRKAQNRAAQQAFRKRKEMHVKDLETRLSSLEAAQQKVLVENENLKQDLDKMATENEILRATSQISNNNLYSVKPSTVNGHTLYVNTMTNETSTPLARVIWSRNDEKLLDAGAAWEFIINHGLFKKGLVDVGDVSERLKHCARYDKHRLVLPEREISVAIEQSVASRTDDLL